MPYPGEARIGVQRGSDESRARNRERQRNDEAEAGLPGLPRLNIETLARNRVCGPHAVDPQAASVPGLAMGLSLRGPMSTFT